MSKLKLFVLMLTIVALVPVAVLAAGGVLIDPAETWELGYKLWLYISFIIWADIL